MNKRTLRIGSAILIAASALVLLRLVTLESGPVPAPAAFRNLPVGRAVPVRLQLGDPAFQRFTDLEKRNQVRDWLLYTVMSDTGMDTSMLRKALYDVPPLRAHYMEPVAHFDYGETRSRSLGNGEIVAVVPKVDAASRADQLAELADREYKNTGEKPKWMHVFEYEVDSEGETGTVTRLASIPGNKLFQTEYGYREAAIRSQADFAVFLRSMDSLIAARMEDGVLYLGGRKLLGTPYRGLRVEDTAALWQSERAVQAAAARMKEFDERWKNARYRTESEKEELKARYDRELKALKSAKDAMVKHSGFSLDPAFDYEALGELFRQAEPYLRQTPAGAEAIAKAAEGLRERKEGPFLQLLYNLEQGSDEKGQKLAHYIEQRLEYVQFQHARYDGPLKGTEAGMVLFYTDLLAKLWAMDYMETAPSSQVEDFASLLKIDVSPIYKKEMEDLSNTRLWFGPQDDGFQKTDHAILFAPKATRVYAASSNTLKPGEEAEPNAASAAFLGWWNNHYEDVARYEPEYQRLNEIMKWSLLFSWLGDQHEMERLQFLATTPVKHDAWFPVWARNNPNLKFRYWDRVQFFPAGYKGVETESLPLLHSRWFKLSRGAHAISGGVSLASEDLMTARPLLSKSVDPLLRRSNLDYSAQEFGKEAFQTFDKTVYEFRSGLDNGLFLVSAATKSGGKLRGVDSELRNAPFEYGYRAKVNGLAVDIRNGDVEVGEFLVEKRPDGFVAAFKARDIENANRYGRVVEQASVKGEDVARALASQSDVESVVKLPDGYLVRTRGLASRWMRISPEGAPKTNIATDAQMRFASMGGDDSRLNIAWISDGDAAKTIDQSEFVVIHPSPRGAADGVAMEITNKGPPPSLGAAREIDVQYGKVQVKGRQFGENGPVYVSRRSLPPEVAQDARLIGRPVLGKEGSAPDVFSRMQDGDVSAGARRLAEAPAKFRQEFALYRQRTIHEADELARGGRYQEALRRIEKAAEFFGDDPELTLRRVTLARARDLSDRLAKTPALGADIRLVPDHGALKLEVRLLEMKRATVPAAEARRADTVYVASDRNGMGTYDPSVSIHGSTDQVISDDAIASKLVSWEIAQARPDVIEDVRLQKRYELHSKTETVSGRARSSGSSVRTQRPNFTNHDPCSTEEARRQNRDCSENVYLVDAPPTMTARLQPK